MTLPLHPSRVLFPLGIGFAIIGIGIWIPYVLWPHAFSNPGQGHAILQIQGFLLSFILGFLLTLLPLKLGMKPIGPWAFSIFPMGICALLLLAFWHFAMASQTVHLLLITNLLLFGFRPDDSKRRQVLLDETSSAEFAITCIGLSLGADLAGTLISLGSNVGILSTAWSRGGSLLQIQAFPVLMIMGLGSLFLPPLFGNKFERGIEQKAPARSLRLARSIGLATLFLASFAIEPSNHGLIRLAYIIRASVWAWFLFGEIRIHTIKMKLPTHIKAIRGSLFALGVGLTMPIVAPIHLLAWEHVVFITGFLWLILGGCAHLTMVQQNRLDLLFHHPRKAKAMRMLRFFALFSRVGSDLWMKHYWMLMAMAAAAAVSGLVLWAGLYFPLLLWEQPLEKVNQETPLGFLKTDLTRRIST